jgi:hypothetical protein
LWRSAGGAHLVAEHHAAGRLAVLHALAGRHGGCGCGVVTV